MPHGDFMHAIQIGYTCMVAVEMWHVGQSTLVGFESIQCILDSNWEFVTCLSMCHNAVIYDKVFNMCCQMLSATPFAVSY